MYGNFLRLLYTFNSLTFSSTLSTLKIKCFYFRTPYLPNFENSRDIKKFQDVCILPSNATFIQCVWETNTRLVVLALVRGSNDSHQAGYTKLTVTHNIIYFFLYKTWSFDIFLLRNSMRSESLRTRLFFFFVLLVNEASSALD